MGPDIWHRASSKGSTGESEYGITVPRNSNSYRTSSGRGTRRMNMAAGTDGLCHVNSLRQIHGRRDSE
jgi:hypothetical protein